LSASGSVRQRRPRQDGACVAPAPAVWSMTSTLLLLCLQARESWLTVELTGPSAGPRVLHRPGRGVAAAASVGVALRVPKQSSRGALPRRSRLPRRREGAVRRPGWRSAASRPIRQRRRTRRSLLHRAVQAEAAAPSTDALEFVPEQVCGQARLDLSRLPLSAERWHVRVWRVRPPVEGGRTSRVERHRLKARAGNSRTAGHSNRRYRPCPTVCDGSGWTLRARGGRG
jgi:hypothetical protein